MTKEEMIAHIIEVLEYLRESPDIFQPGDCPVTANCGGSDTAISESQGISLNL